MKTLTRLLAITLVSVVALTACGGGGGGGGGGGVTNPPPPVADQSPAGVWNGQAVTQGAPDVFESFEFNAIGGFPSGTSPFSATYSDGNAETRMVPGFYITGLNAWHILNGTSATVTFETPPRTLSLWARTAFLGDVGEVRILDVNMNLILIVALTNSYGIQPIVVTRTAGQTSIGSIVVTSTVGGGGGDVVIDDLTFGYLSTTDDINCLVAETLEFACILTDATTGALLAGAQGTLQVTGTQVTSTDTNTLVAAPGTTLVDGSIVANLTITGTVSENTSLNLTIAAAGVSTSVTTTFNALYDRGSDLANLDDNYTFDIFGDPGSFSVNANGVITVATLSGGCVGNGQISVIDAGFNAYDVSLTLDVATCGAVSGLYDGLGLTEDDVATDDVFTFAVFTTDSVIVASPIQ